MGVVVLARPGQLPVRAREQRVGPRAAPQVQRDGTIRPCASPGAAVRGLRDLLSLSRPTCHSFFTGPVFCRLDAHSPRVYLPVKAGENSFFYTVLRYKMLFFSSVCLYTDEKNNSFCTILHGFCMT